MSMVAYTLNELLLHYIGLVAIFSPVAAIVPFINVTGHYSKTIQHKIARRVAVISLLFLLIGSWTGPYILRFLGITLPSLRAAGGLILLLSAIPMVLKGNSPRQRDVEKKSVSEEWKSVVVVPLVFPFTIGAASLSYVITLMGNAKSIWDHAGVTGIILLDGISIWFTYFLASRLGRRISSTGNDILVRIGGIIVMAIGFSLLSQGLRELLPGLA